MPIAAKIAVIGGDVGRAIVGYVMKRVAYHLAEKRHGRHELSTLST